jgi:nucleoside 2-deoxyribosyltransferase
MSNDPAEFLAAKGIRSVFVAGPFYGLVDEKTGVMDDSAQRRITMLIDYFEQAGCTVYNAHRREAWGKEFLTADVCTKLDFDEIAAADLWVGYPGVPVSPGTHVEIGWASATGKPMVVLLEKEKRHSFLVTGLSSIANISYVEFDDPAEIIGQLPAAIDEATTAAQRRAA